MRIPGASTEPISHSERRWKLIFALMVVLITTIPYILGFINQSSDWSFTGILMGTEDSNSYMSEMITGSSGAWLYRTAYTAYPQRGAIVFMTYILLGKLASPPNLHLKILMLFQLYRMTACFLVVLATYDFLSFFITDPRWRKYGTVLATFGGGLGWIIPLFGNATYLGRMSIEFYSPEAFGFLMLFNVPHLTLARAFFLWGLRSFLITNNTRGRTLILASLRTGFLWLLTALSQPLTGLLVGAVPLVYLIVTGLWQFINRIQHKIQEWKKWLNILYSLLIAGSIAGPFAIYSIFSFTTDPSLTAWVIQNNLPSADITLYLFVYLLILPFSFIGAFLLLKREKWKGLFLIQWVVVFLAAIYIPFSLQRRLNEGIYIGLVGLACFGFLTLTQKVRKPSWVRIASNLLLAFSLVSTVLLIVSSILAISHPSEPLFIPSGEAQAIEFLGTRIESGDIVLTSYKTGNILPSWIPVRVILGFKDQGINYNQLIPEVKKFFQPDTQQNQRKELIARFGVKYIFWGPEERNLGDWNPSQMESLQKIYDDRGYSIFQVATQSTNP